MRSIIQTEKACYICGTMYDLHEHHIIYGTANRKQSERYGLKVWLCGYHHNMSNEGVHFNKEADTQLKQIAQKRFEQVHGDRDAFRSVFGKSYI